MANDLLIANVKDYFLRQIAWLEQVVRDKKTGTAIQNDERALEQRLREETACANEMIAFQRELNALARKWDAAEGISQADRDAVHLLALKVEKIGGELLENNDESRREVEQMMEELRENWNALRRGRDMVNKYSHGQQSNRDYLDWKA